MRILLSIILLFLPKLLLASENELNFLTWADYIKPEIIKRFEQESGIKVNVDYVDSHYILEAKIMANGNEYDITTPTLAPFFIRQVQFGLFMPIEFNKLQHYHSIDPNIIAFEKAAENSDKYAVPFMLDSVGIGYDYNKIKAIMPNAPIDSLEIIFNPNILKNFSSCGVEILDSPEEIISLALIYLELNPNSESEEDLNKVAALLNKIRPFINSINGSLYFNNLGSGDNCLVLGYAGDILHAKKMSLTSGNKLDIKYTLPKEGSIMTLDLLAIPKSSLNKAAAYKFIDFILRPDINAEIANNIGFASPNKASYPFIKKEYIDDFNIYPQKSQKLDKLHSLKVPSPSFNRLRNRIWIKFISDELGSN